MGSRSDQRDTEDSSRTKLMSDMDPDGMDSEFEEEADLDSPENITESARMREQESRLAGTPGSQAKEPPPIRSRRVDEADEGENEDEEDEDMEPRATPRSASHTPPNRRESERTRPSSPGDRRR
jgi:hypothetical protein